MFERRLINFNSYELQLVSSKYCRKPKLPGEQDQVPQQKLKEAKLHLEEPVTSECSRFEDDSAAQASAVKPE